MRSDDATEVCGVVIDKVRLHAAVAALDHALDHPFGDRDDLHALFDTDLADVSMTNLWAAFADLAQAAHEIDDPHCTCNDCLDGRRACDDCERAFGPHFTGCDHRPVR